jgi:hypothetical protein
MRGQCRLIYRKLQGNPLAHLLQRVHVLRDDEAPLSKIREALLQAVAKPENAEKSFFFGFGAPDQQPQALEAMSRHGVSWFGDRHVLRVDVAFADAEFVRRIFRDTRAGECAVRDVGRVDFQPSHIIAIGVDAGAVWWFCPT